MKTITFILLLAACALSAYSQNITNTLGTGGVFTIKDASHSYLTLSQIDGLFSLNKNLNLLNTTSSSIGIITKGGNRFIHDFAPAGANGGNTFIGTNSGNFSMSGSTNNSSCNTGIGCYSLLSLTTGYTNTAVGYSSLFSNTTGSDNTAVGQQSLTYNTTGTQNTAVGTTSLRNNTTGNLNTAVGYASLWANTTGTQNTATGYQSLYSNTTGTDNTAVGATSLQYNTTGGNNTAEGYASLNSNTTGDGNTAVGGQSLYSNTTGGGNIAVGYQSLQNNTTGGGNIAVGCQSLQFNTTGYANIAVGSSSLVANTSGAWNIAVGSGSLYRNTTGQNNTVLGYFAGADITTGSNNIIIGYNASPSSASVSHEITLGDVTATVLRCAVQVIHSLSDARDKKNIHDLSLGIDFLMKLKPRLFNWDKREWYKDNKSDGSKIQKTPTAGFIAQELDEVQTKENAEWLNLVLKNNPDKLEAAHGNLLPVMVKAIQELKAENNDLKAKLDKFERMQNVLVSEIEQLKLKDAELTQVKSGN